MASSILAALLAFAGYTFLNLGQAGQKIGLGMRHDRRFLGWFIWVIATAATSVSFFLVYSAISMGSVVIVGAMGGTGLASLALFSRFVMGERLTVVHVLAVVVIIVGAAAVALLNVPGDGRFSGAMLYGALAGGVLLYCTGWILLKEEAMVGVIMGGLSGFLGAYSQLFQKLGAGDVSVSDGIVPLVRSVVTNPITLIWVGLSLASMGVIQFAYKKVEAIRIIPVFTANFIVVPVVGGVLVFGERLAPVQWVCVVAILAASVLLSRSRAVL